MAPKGEYGVQFWLNAGKKNHPTDKSTHRYGLPERIHLSGFNRQITAIIPSRNIVVVRLGVTHNKSDWNQEKFIRQVLDCVHG